jgi:hypothetical protein
MVSIFFISALAIFLQPPHIYLPRMENSIKRIIIEAKQQAEGRNTFAIEDSMSMLRSFRK